MTPPGAGETEAMLARDVMSRRVVTAAPEMTLHEAAELLIDNQITGVPVVGPEGVLVGLVSQTDLVRHERESKPPSPLPAYYRDDHVMPPGFEIERPERKRVKDCMTPIVISAHQDDSVMELARVMLEKKIHRIVITENGRLKGIVTTVDLLQGLMRLLQRGGRANKPRGAVPRWAGPSARAKRRG